MSGLLTDYMKHGSGAPSGAPSVPSGESAYYYDETNDLFYVWNTVASAWQTATVGATLGANTFTGTQTMPAAIIAGLTGSTAGMCLVGSTASGAPTTGAHLVGDVSLSLADGLWYTCTVAGTPGTWVTPSSGGSGALSVIGTPVTLTGTQASVTFSSIPGTYKHLAVRWVARSDTAATFAWMQLRFDAGGGTSHNSGFYQLSASNFATGSDVFGAAVGYAGMMAAASSPSNQAGSGQIDIDHYANTTFYKNWRARSMNRMSTAGGDTRDEYAVGTYNSTSAITSITLLPSAGNFIAGSVFELLGVS